MRTSAPGSWPEYDGSMPAPVCLIVNPAAGGGKAGAVAPDVERRCASSGLEVRRVDTRDLEHARELASEAARAGETVVALSGDGMIGVVADALRESPAPCSACFPGGRGNDLARVLGIPEEPDGRSRRSRGHRRAVDLGVVDATGARLHGRAFVGIASVGFDSDANRIANEAPAGSAGSSTPTARCARSRPGARRASRSSSTLPASASASAAYTVGAANSKTYGGGMRAAPDALLDDGLLEVVVLESVGKLGFLTKLLPKVFKGTHVEQPSVHVFRAAAVEIAADRPFTMYADGDPIGELPVRVRALGGAITVLVPADAAAASPRSPRRIPSPSPTP